MSGRKPGRFRSTTQRREFVIEALEAREVLSGGGIGHTVGSFVNPSTSFPRVSSPAIIVQPHPAVEQSLSMVLGPALVPIHLQADYVRPKPQNVVADRIGAVPAVHAVLSDYDTYQLLNSGAINGVLAQGPLAPPASFFATVPLSQIVGNQTSLQNTVTINPSDIINPLSSALTVPYTISVPSANIQRNPQTGMAIVTIPAAAAVQQVPGGTLGGVFSATSAVLTDALRSGRPLTGPTAARTVPGLRLERALENHHNFPQTGTSLFLRMMRVAVDRKLFTLSGSQTNQVNTAVSQFLTTVHALSQSGTFQPPVPLAPPTLVSGPLKGTLQVSFGALRQLANVSPNLTGLQLPFVGNFPGRLDVGYVFDRAGNYGLFLAARGPLAAVPPGLSSMDRIGGDIQVQVSNAPGLNALNGLRTVEGLTLGSVYSADLEATNTNNVATLGASVGYGAGFEFGTGAQYTQVIPLGNVFRLVQ